jgi:streptogramin lyase
MSISLGARRCSTLAGLLTLLASYAHADFYVTSRDGGNGDLYRYNNSGGFVAKYPGNGLNNGQGVIIGPNGNLLVSNEEGKNILQYNPNTGAFIGVFATLSTSPGGLAVGPDNNVYVSVGSVVQKLNGQTGALISNFATTNLVASDGLAFGPNGNLFVSDGVQTSIKQFNGTTGAFVNNFATSASFGNGAGPLMFFNGVLLVSQIFGTGGAPWGNAILKFDQSTGAFLGNFASDPAQLNAPSGMVVGPDGNLYVVNYVGNNIVRYTSSGTFLGVFANTATNGASAPRYIAYAATTTTPTPPLTPTPIPSSVWLLLSGIIVLAGWRYWCTRTGSAH